MIGGGRTTTPLPSPAELRAEHPVTASALATCTRPAGPSSTCSTGATTG